MLYVEQLIKVPWLPAFLVCCISLEQETFSNSSNYLTTLIHVLRYCIVRSCIVVDCLKAFGNESTYGPHAREGLSESREVFLWFAVSHSNKKALEIFSREIAPAGTGMGK